MGLAKSILKAELAYRSITHQSLAEMLNEIGCLETKASIDSKLSRGKFSAEFFLNCLLVIGVSDLELKKIERDIEVLQ